MRNLTEQEIQDLESRGIKPGIPIRCAYIDEDIFNFDNWDQVLRNEGGLESIKVYQSSRRFWILDAEKGRYATPVDQPSPEVGTLEPAPIDWEQRRWELVAMAVQGILSNPERIDTAEWVCKQAIEYADAVLSQYKNTPMQ